MDNHQLVGGGGGVGDNMDYVYFQSTVTSLQNIKSLSIVFILLSFQKLFCFCLQELMHIYVSDLWNVQREYWYYFAVLLGACSYSGSYLVRIMDTKLHIGFVSLILVLYSLAEAYLTHFCLGFLPKSLQKLYWEFQLSLFAFFALYFERYCRRVEFKALSKIQLFFILFITLVFTLFHTSMMYFVVAHGFVFNIIGYVHSYKTISFLFAPTYGWQHTQYLRTSLDLYIDNQVLFPLALIDTANFVIDAIGYE